MKSMIMAALISATTLASALAPHAAQADVAACRATFSLSAVDAKNMSWRLIPDTKDETYMSLTNRNQSAGFSRTNAAREKLIRKYSLEAKEQIYVNDIEAYGFDLFPEVGVSEDYLQNAGNYKSGQLALIKFSGVAPSGILRATLALPVSGRFGKETTMKWAKSDTYNIYIADPSGKRTNLITRAKSLDLLTIQEIEIPLIKNQEIKLFYERSGSAGPMGFPEGRIMRLTWDGN